MAGIADTIPDLTNLDKAAQLAALRRSTAAITGRRDHAPTDSDDSPAFPPRSRTRRLPRPTAMNEP